VIAVAINASNALPRLPTFSNRVSGIIAQGQKPFLSIDPARAHIFSLIDPHIYGSRTHRAQGLTYSPVKKMPLINAKTPATDTNSASRRFIHFG
jgi:hypothetical protein